VVTIASTTDTQPDEEHAFYPSTGPFTRGWNDGRGTYQNRLFHQTDSL